jgi:hypothetical protein
VIRKRTVFILGAGASMPYGFPSGEGLLKSARQLTEELIGEVSCGQLRKSQSRELKIALADNLCKGVATAH